VYNLEWQIGGSAETIILLGWHVPLLRQRESSSHGQVQVWFSLESSNLIHSGGATPPAHSGMITESIQWYEKQKPVHGIRF